jgi:hypothetical protein
MRCPVCQLELGVERQAGEGDLVLKYSFKDWVERCGHQRGDPMLCANLMPTILELLLKQSGRSAVVKPWK